jgi:hypothetical protein
MTAPGSFDSLTAPTIESAKITFAAIEHTVDLVCDDCRTVCETLSSLGEALGVLTESESLDGGLSGASLVGLPMLAAVRAAKAIAGRYVAQQTGAPLDTWVELVADASTQFEAYLAQLETVDQIARRYHSTEQGAQDPTQTREDLEVLQQTQWQTRAWKQILGRVARLGQLVDAILHAQINDDAAAPEAAARASGFSASLQRRIQDVQTWTADKTGDLREWVLQPFVEIRDKVMELPAQTQRLSGQIETLEILLDLEVVTIRACAGEISPAAARVIGIRVAANAARAVIEQQEPPGDRRRLLQRERQRLDEARGFLASL